MSTYKSLAILAEEASKNVSEITSDGLDALKAGTIVIDVREQSEADAGMIPGAVHISRGLLEVRIAKKLFEDDVTAENLETPILLYCGGGHRSLLAAESLKKMGFKDVTSLKGGYKAWTESQ